MSGPMAFSIFLSHWVREENDARRAQFYKKMQKQVKTSVHVKAYVQEFKDRSFTRVLDDPVEKRLRSLGYYLGKSNAVYGVCRYCEKNLARFEFDHPIRQRILYVACDDMICSILPVLYLGDQ